MSNPEHHDVVVIGAGFSGIGLAIKLREAGIEDFVLLERASDLGGTWRDNTYPGCGCDVPSRLYSFSFAPNPDWSHAFSGQQEIWDYLRGVAERYGVTRSIRYGHEVTAATWDGERWCIETSAGAFTARSVVYGGGLLSDPVTPQLPGIERFRGTAFHSARWDHGHDLGGERVAVIGTGASAIQFVPEIQPLARELHVFQRTAPWVMPRRNRPISAREKRLFRRSRTLHLLARGSVYLSAEVLVLAFMYPRLMRLPERVARRHLERQVPDPALRERLRPQFTIGCKRILFSDDWYPALGRPNVELVTDAIAEVREHSIVTADGEEREIDTIIYGTGFHVTDTPFAGRVRGRDGRTLAETWNGSPKAFNGTAIPGFPNFFMLLGPNTGLGHTSVLYMVESQLAYVVGALKHLSRSGAATLDVRSSALAEWVREMDGSLASTVWNAGGCRSWYLDRTGRNATIWPGPTFRFRRRLRTFDPAPYELGAAQPAVRARLGVSERATTATTRAPATSLLTAITAIAVPVVLTGTALIVLAQVWIVDVGYALPGFPDDGLGMADGVRRDLAHTGIRSVAPWDGTGIARLEGARLPGGEAAFGPREIAHMADVRAVMTGFLWAWLAGVAVLCACAVALRGAGSRALARGLRTGVWISVGAYLVAGLLMLADFDRFFESFHGVFFSGDSWVFGDGDTLLALYPEVFWGFAGGLFVLLVVGGGLAVLALARRIESRTA